ELKEAQDKLRGLADALDEEIDIVQRYRKQLQALEEEEKAIREQIEDKDGKIADEEKEALEALEDIEDELDAMEEEGLEAATFRDSKEKIQSNLQTLQTIADHIRNIEKQQEEEDSNTCVVCGRSFDSSRGLKIHQSQKHTEDEIEQARQEQDDDGDSSSGLFGRIRDAVS
ncbi:MAG: hypothetical protein SVU32_07450, partial [Candidatus Nanohaloarchaea archaeon]|nr:hypothetical protein [Candidatus Nanohaloarchaea archaeon]